MRSSILLLIVVALLPTTLGGLQDAMSHVGKTKTLCRKKYKFISELASGGSSMILTAEHKGRLFAIKIMELSPRAENEIDMMDLINNGHANIITMHCAVETQEWAYMVLDYVSHGDLYGTILEEAQVKSLVKQLASAMAFLRSKHIVHRDIKPEHMLLNEDNQLTLIDFSQAVRLVPGWVLSVPVGTSAHKAPEMGQLLLVRCQSRFMVDWLDAV